MTKSELVAMIIKDLRESRRILKEQVKEVEIQADEALMAEKKEKCVMLTGKSTGLQTGECALVVLMAKYQDLEKVIWTEGEDN